MSGLNNGAGKKVPLKQNKLHTMPEKIPEGTVLKDTKQGQWKVGTSIGAGSFGVVYTACRVGEENLDYIVKCEPHENGTLFVEMHFFIRQARLEAINRFQCEHGLKSLGMPHMIGHGCVDIRGHNLRFLVMPRYGTDIEKHFVANRHRLPEATIYRLALQMLNVYEFIHSCGYVHGDLKASNIVVGRGTGDANVAKAYLVDFGLVSRFTTKAFRVNPKKRHNGTIEYTSRDAHRGVSTMRGDLEILGYNMIVWFGVQLPWVKNNLLAAPVKVQKAKDKFMTDVSKNLQALFPNGVPGPISAFMEYVAKMEYNETPDYEKFRKIFSNALETMNLSIAGDLQLNMKDENNLTSTVNNTNFSIEKQKITQPKPKYAKPSSRRNTSWETPDFLPMSNHSDSWEKPDLLPMSNHPDSWERPDLLPMSNDSDSSLLGLTVAPRTRKRPFVSASRRNIKRLKAKTRSRTKRRNRPLKLSTLRRTAVSRTRKRRLLADPARSAKRHRNKSRSIVGGEKFTRSNRARKLLTSKISQPKRKTAKARKLAIVRKNESSKAF